MTRILVDLLGFTGTRGGTETYVRELLPRLARLMPEFEFVALTGRVGRSGVTEFFPGRVHTIRWVGASPSSWALGAATATNRTARKLGADLLWAPANFGPIARGVPRVVTVHDAIYDDIVGRGALQRVQRGATSWLMTRSARTAGLVLTVSHAAAASIGEHLGVPGERIRVVHNGSEEPRPVSNPWAALAGLNLPHDRPIVLSTGNRMPHKNFEGLLDALTRIPRDERPMTVVAGSRLPDPLAAEISRRGLHRDVVLPGWVSDDQLEALFQVATLYVCPSLAEGFGLPIVDALRRGVAVVANDIPVLREVGGSVARYAPVDDADAFSAAIMDSINAPISAQGRAAACIWAAQFTWDGAAENTASVLRATLDETESRTAQ